MEFFHYARTSIDILFQIINAALLGDQSLEVDDKYLLKKANDTLEKNDNFKPLKSLLDANKKDDTLGSCWKMLLPTALISAARTDRGMVWSNTLILLP